MDATKRDILYPRLDSETNDHSSSSSQRAAACASIGLPTDLPPSYDMALGRQTQSYREPISVNTEPQYDHAAPAPAPASAPTTSTQQTRSSRSRSRSSRIKPVKLGPIPSAMTCPECGEYRTTRMHFTPNIRTHLIALLLCLAGWCCCACFVPYCMDSCKTGNHYCSKCSKYLGYHTTSWRT